MADMALISGAVASLKAANDIAKGMLTLRDGALIQGKVIELQSVILDAQSSVFAVNQERSALIESIGELEKKVAAMEAWRAERERYALKEIAPSVLAYLLKESERATEPLHALCANCYQNRKKSILQFQGNYYSVAKFKCHSCNSEIDAAIDQPLFPFKNIVNEY